MEKTVQKKTATPKIQTKIQGHPVTLYFSPKPNLNIASRIKQSLLSVYLQSDKKY